MAEISADKFTAKVRPIVLANRTYSKIFGIGANKTGTTSLEYTLRLYGLNLPDQQLQAASLTKQTRLGNYEPFKRFVDQYDAFQDTPFSTGNTYIVADALFANSKFILTERDPNEWFESLYRFHQRQTGVDDLRAMTREDVRTRFRYLYPGFMLEAFEYTLLDYVEGRPAVCWDLLYDRDHFVEQYARRNREIRKHFHNRPNALLCIDMTTEKDTAKICRFLGIPDRFIVEMPHLNRTR